MDSSVAQSALSKLPDEVLLKIFKLLPTHEIIGNILHVCERWREVVVNYIPWKNAKADGDLKEDWNTRFTFDFGACSLHVLRKAVAAGVKIKYLKLKTFGRDPRASSSDQKKCELADDIFEIICRNKLPLHTLELESVIFNGKIGLFDVLDKCPLLSSLKLERSSDVRIWKSMNYDDSKTLNYLTMTDLKLVSFEVKDYERENEWIIQLINRCPSLCSIKLSARHVTSQLVQALSELKHLETLDFSSVITNGKDILQPLENNSTLKTFIFSPHRPSYWKYEIFDVVSISSWTAVKKLKMVLVCKSDLEMSQFLRTLPLCIEDLSIRTRIEEMTDEHLLLLSKRIGPHVKTIKLDIDEHDFTDSGLRVFFRNMKELEYIKLEFGLEGYNDSQLPHQKNTWVKELVNHPKLKQAVIQIKDGDSLPNNYFNLIEKSPLVCGSVIRDDDDEGPDYGCMFINISWKRK